MIASDDSLADEVFRVCDVVHWWRVKPVTRADAPAFSPTKARHCVK